MQEFILQRNIERYRELLAEGQDEAQCKVLRELLAEAEAQLEQLGRSQGPADGAPKTRE